MGDKTADAINTAQADMGSGAAAISPTELDSGCQERATDRCIAMLDLLDALASISQGPVFTTEEEDALCDASQMEKLDEDTGTITIQPEVANQFFGLMSLQEDLLLDRDLAEKDLACGLSQASPPPGPEFDLRCMALLRHSERKRRGYFPELCESPGIFDEVQPEVKEEMGNLETPEFANPKTPESSNLKTPESSNPKTPEHNMISPKMEKPESPPPFQPVTPEMDDSLKTPSQKNRRKGKKVATSLRRGAPKSKAAKAMPKAKAKALAKAETLPKAKASSKKKHEKEKQDQKKAEAKAKTRSKRKSGNIQDDPADMKKVPDADLKAKMHCVL